MNKDIQLFAIAHMKYGNISAQKCRLIVNLIRQKPVNTALDILQFDCHKAAKILSKLLLSAIANAEHNYGLNIDNLYVTEIFANNAPIVKRFRARAKGRGNTIFKRRSHISIKVSEIIKKNNIRIK